jgi:hypothetical protein
MVLMDRNAFFLFVFGCAYALRCLVSYAALAVFVLSHTLLAKSYTHVTFPYLPDHNPYYTSTNPSFMAPKRVSRFLLVRILKQTSKVPFWKLIN